MSVTGKYSLKGKAAIVTGAAGGICSAIAHAFAEAGAKVACVDLDVKGIREGRDFIAIRCDVSSESETRLMRRLSAQAGAQIRMASRGNPCEKAQSESFMRTPKLRLQRSHPKVRVLHRCLFLPSELPWSRWHTPQSTMA